MDDLMSPSNETSQGLLAEVGPDPESAEGSNSNKLNELPEEIVLNILSHMGSQELFALSCTTQSMNRLGIQYLLGSRGIPKATSRCKLILNPSPDSPTNLDEMKILLHSTHIKDFKDLSLYYTRFHSYSALAPAFRRSLRLLQRLDSVRDMTLFFGLKGNEPTDETHLKEMTIALEDLLNEIVLKSARKIRVFGSEELLGQFYQFRKASDLAAQSLDLEKMDIETSQDTNNDGPDTVDDLRYPRTAAGSSRIFLRCSPEALKNTQLAHFNFGTADVLRPPFSQWFFTMMKASQIQSFSFGCSHLPSDSEELEYVLHRLASALSHITWIYLYDITASVLPSIIKWLTSFPLLQTLHIKPGSADSTYLGLLKPSLISETSTDSEAVTTHSPTTFTSASPLRSVNGPHQFLTHLFTPPGTGEEGSPSKLEFPNLETVLLEYVCTWVTPDFSVLANALRRIKAALPESQSLSSSLTVHIKFDKDFRGLTSSTFKGIIKPEDVRHDDAEVIAEVETLRLSLPGKQEEIAQGEFDEQVIGALTVFSGAKDLTLLSNEHTDKAKEQLGWLHSQVFKERNKGLRVVYLRDTPK